MQNRKQIGPKFGHERAHWLNAKVTSANCANCGSPSHATVLTHHPYLGLSCNKCAFAAQVADELIFANKKTPTGWFDGPLETLAASKNLYLISKLADWALRAHNWPTMED
jgi:hypothetical protein